VTAGTRTIRRHRAVTVRKGPQPGRRLIVGVDGRVWPSDPVGPPDEVLVAATDERGALVRWWRPEWWSRRLAGWSRIGLTVVVLPTPGALLHEAVVGQLAEVRGARPYWRFVGCSDGAALASMEAIHKALTGPYDELRIFAPVVRDGWSGAAGGAGLRNQTALHVLKQLVELRNARHLRRPKVAWICRLGGSLSDPDESLWVRQTARQLGVDRLCLEESAEFESWV